MYVIFENANPSKQSTSHNSQGVSMKRIALIGFILLCSVAISSAQIGLKAIGGGVGFTSVSFNSGTSTESLGGFSIGAAANLGELVPGLSLFSEVGYWTASKTISGTDWSVSDFVINANVVYRFAAGGSVTPYAGGGLGLNFFSSTVEVPAVPPFFPGGTFSGSETQIGINLLGGASFALNDQMSIGGQFRYVISSDANHLMILATFMYSLGGM